MDEPIYQPNANVIATELDAEMVLLDVITRRYYTLNDTGSRIWQLVQQGLGLTGIAEALTVEWDIELPEAKEQVRMLVEDLVTEGLIVQARA